MKDIALELAHNQSDNKRHVLREYLQNYILFLVQKSKMGADIYFVGGTALRFLFKIARYSEDIDFSAGQYWKSEGLSGYLKKIENELKKAGYRTTTRTKQKSTIQKVTFGFQDLLYEAGLSHRAEQKFSIHLEIDTNPPTGWHSKKTLVNLYLPVMLQHYDLSSLFAGKIHAVLTRTYTKGRDLFDLFWYRSRWKELTPNFIMLNNALDQTRKNHPEVNQDNWLELLYQKVAALNWKQIVTDVDPFIENEADMLSFTKSNLLGLCR